MPTGVSHLYRPIQPDPAFSLKPNESYFLIRIHDAQAFFPANMLKQAKWLLVSSSVESSFLSDKTQSLHKLTTMKRDVPCRLGVNTDLTSWLPARATDKVRIVLSYKVLQGAPIKTLVDKMEQIHLEAAVSLIQPQMAVAIKISEIVGHLLSHVLHEDGQTELFPLTMDRNVADLESGYYAVLGSLTNETFPSTLEIKNGYLTGRSGHELSRYSYVVFHVQTMLARGSEIVRSEPWGELLQACKDEVLNATIRNEEDRDEAVEKWLVCLEHVRFLARKDRSFLQSEVNGTIGEAQIAVEKKLGSRTTPEAQGLEEESYSDEWQKVLGFSTPQELRQAVRDYQDAVELTERLLQQYHQP